MMSKGPINTDERVGESEREGERERERGRERDYLHYNGKNINVIVINKGYGFCFVLFCFTTYQPFPGH